MGMRNTLKELTVEVLWGRLLPATAYEEWKKEHARYEQGFWEGVEYLCDNLRKGDCLLDQMREAYSIIFSDTWERLSKTDLFSTESIPIGKEEFVQEAVDDILSSVPSSEEVRSKHFVEASFYDAPLSDEIEEAELRAAQLRLDHIKTDKAIEETKKGVIEEMRQKVAEQTEKRRREIEESLTLAETTFYSGILEVVNSVSESINNKGKLSGRISVQIRNLADRIKSLNVFDDSLLEKQIDELIGSLDTRSSANLKDKESALAEIQNKIAETGSYIQKQLKDLPSRRGIRFEMENTEEGIPEIESGTERAVSTEETDMSGFDEEEVSSKRFVSTPD